MPRCLYTLTQFESANAEHILQNFLGARWRSNSIVCDEQQAIFGSTIDSALEKGLRPIRNLFGTRGGRGESGPIIRKLRASDGELYDLEPGFRVRLHQPIVKTIELTEGQRIAELLLGSSKHLDWALSILRREVPDLSVDKSILRDAAKNVPLPDSTVQLSLCLGGEDYFRGMLKSCFNLLGVKYPTLVYDPCFDGVRNTVRFGGGDFHKFIRWVPTVEPINVPRLGPIDQAIFIVSRGSSVEGVVQFFGEIIHPFQLTDSYEGEPIRCGYVVDPFRGAQPAETRHPEFDEKSIPVYEDQSPTPTPAIIATFRERSSRLLRVFNREIALQRIVEEIVEEVLRPYVGQTFTPEIAAQLANRFTERLATHVGLAQESQAE